MCVRQRERVRNQEIHLIGITNICMHAYKLINTIFKPATKGTYLQIEIDILYMDE